MGELEKFISEFRKQRHDFMNYVQIIYGYLQLDKKEDAKRYINKIIGENKNISKIYSLGDQYFGFCIENLIKELNEKEIEFELDIEINGFSKKVFCDEYYKKQKILNNIFHELENNNLRFVYIYIFEDELGESLLIANGESSANELDWMEEWKEINIDLNDTKLHKYVYGNNLAYRLTFI
ncbi:Spo0B domain-containing protein [Clostridium botulinum]|uniref:SpoOB alpha-helical domain-containing protein n=1 Tax=Clostridium botulinum C/D str. DC5 TaxID=1443128 RepID=A0A0A0IFE1_CLOBO|nr:Spo0B domain-containing protein [Clostridium botulinum]KEI00993.1 hypothetical protein Z952_13530 [Clostridium botulinum C/D str. BKT75002]KEI11159.1 hypothetical protein Z954_09390 [Clostridium botulinum C/D str. BKT2873]KGM94029.1 hypothetical protein Z956_08915 [Clostridium botulinum D str. CCUG 7971]KGM99021.1 hypothetical protein Z955_09385 [Clostridium botulinum C/D str. DC5]KOC47382.1 hypothetical protein ADU88_10335 [Clostridium botulinum]